MEKVRNEKLRLSGSLITKVSKGMRKYQRIRKSIILLQDHTRGHLARGYAAQNMLCVLLEYLIHRHLKKN